MPPLDVRQVANTVGGVAGETELGRVVEYQDGARGGGEAFGRGREVPAQDDALIDPRVIEEPVGGLGRGPVLAGQRHGRADPVTQVAEQFPQPRFQPLIGEDAVTQLVFHPGVHVRALLGHNSTPELEGPKCDWVLAGPEVVGN